MKTRLSSRPVLSAFIACLFLVACAPADEGGSGGMGGATPSGSGGSTATGGSGAGSGGNLGASGGSPASGGASSPGSGGAPSSGGSPGSGGSDQTGGGGSAGRGSGGRAATGGVGATAGGGAIGVAGQGGGSTGAGGTTAPKPSAGCGMNTTQAATQWVESMVMSGTTSRPYSVRLPMGYDANRAYPVIFLLHGCGSGTNNVPMEKVTGSDAILVRGTGSAADTCWTTAANSADITFFDAMVADVKARFCSDEVRFFAVGYSSGSWLANQLTCIRPTVLRGAGTVTGGESSNGKCTGGVARVFVHDKDDTTNVISGSEKARDRQLTQNGCDKAAQPVAQDPSPCVAYSCPPAYPVVWCATSGQTHGRQDNFAPGVFWNVFKKL